MNVGAIGGYTPISYISPYASAAVGPVNAGNVAGAANTGNVAGGEKITPTEASKGVDAGQSVDGKKVSKTDPRYECQTCENRKYQDGSNEHDVSFKTASKVAPEAAASAVRSHEQMHVKNAYQKQQRTTAR